MVDKKDSQSTLPLNRHLPWLWLTLLLGWEAASLAWSENVTWGFHQLSIQFSLICLPSLGSKCHSTTRTASNLGVPQCSLGHDWGVGLGRLAHHGWRRSFKVGNGPHGRPTFGCLCSLPLALVWGEQPTSVPAAGLPPSLGCIHSRHRLIHFRPVVAFLLGLDGLEWDSRHPAQTFGNSVFYWFVGTDVRRLSGSRRSLSLHPLTTSPPTRLGETRTPIFPRAPCQKVDIGCICFGVNRSG